MSVDNTTYQREYARKRRRQRWLQAALGSRTCPAQMGRHGVCGGVLDVQTDGAGGLVVTCPRCERRRRGVCRDCPAPVQGTVGKAVRCAACARLAALESMATYSRTHRAAVRARARDYAARRDPVKRAESRRLHRHAFPAKVKAAKRRDVARNRQRVERYQRRYNAWRAEAKRQQARAQYRATHPVPSPVCVACARVIPWGGRGVGGNVGRPPSRCVFCEARTHLASLRQAVQRWVRSDAREKVVPKKSTVRPLRPTRRQPCRYNAAGGRLCVAPACETVVQGKAKLCAGCRTSRAAHARQVLYGRSAA